MLKDELGSEDGTVYRTKDGLKFHGRLALVALLALLVTGGSTMRTAGSVSAQPAASIEGAWLLQTDPEDPAVHDVVVFAPGGGLLTSSAPVASVNPEEMVPGFPAGLTRLFSSQGYGVWASVGGREYRFKFISIQYDAEGNYLGLNTVSGRFTVDESGSRLSGAVSVSVTARDGTVTEFPGAPFPFSGTRITVESGQ